MAVRTFLLHVPQESPFNRLHPVTKLFILILINIIAGIIEAPFFLLLIITLTFIFYKIAKVPLSKLKTFLIVLLLFTQSIALSYLLASRIPGHVILHQFPWNAYISDMTIVYAFTMVLRVFTMLVGSTLVLATTRDRDIVYAFSTMRLPYAFGFVIRLGFRTMGVFLDDFFKIREAMMLKGTDFGKGSIIARARKYVYVGIPLAVIAVRRIIETTNAVESKGFTVSGRRTYYHRIPFRKVDVIGCIILASTLAVSLVARYYFNYLIFPGWPFA